MRYPTTSSAARACYCSAVSPLERSPPRLNAVHEVGKDFRLTTIRSIRRAEPVADAGFGQHELRTLRIGGENIYPRELEELLIPRSARSR